MNILAQLNKDFTYRSDPTFLGVRDKWSFGPKSGAFEGDCEDYCLTYVRRIEGSRIRAIKALLAKEVSIWFVRTGSGAGHAVLEHYNGGFLECGKKSILARPDYAFTDWRRFHRWEIVIKLIGIKRLLAFSAIMAVSALWVAI